MRDAVFSSVVVYCWCKSSSLANHWVVLSDYVPTYACFWPTLRYNFLRSKSYSIHKSIPYYSSGTVDSLDDTPFSQTSAVKHASFEDRWFTALKFNCTNCSSLAFIKAPISLVVNALYHNMFFLVEDRGWPSKDPRLICYWVPFQLQSYSDLLCILGKGKMQGISVEKVNHSSERNWL